MTFGRVSYIVLSVLTFVDISTKAESLQLIRGQRDQFSHPKCSSDPSNVCCRGFDAECLINTNCRWCICQRNRNTYKSGKCVDDAAIVPESARQENLFTIGTTINQRRKCIMPDKGSEKGIKLDVCDKIVLEMLWIWTVQDQLLNIRTLQCISCDGDKPRMRPCSKLQPKWSCKETGNKFDLELHGLNGCGQEFTPNRTQWETYWTPSKTCIKTKYKGYRFADGSLLQLMTKTMCSDRSICFTKEISAPVYIENNKCNLNWAESKYMGSDGIWQRVKNTDTKYVTIQRSTIYKLKLKIEQKAFEIWNGSIVRIKINCAANDGKPSEQHWVLLKFETLKSPSTESERSDESKSISGTVVAIIVAVVILVLVLLLVVAFLIFRRRRKRAPKKKTNRQKIQSEGRHNSGKTIAEGDDVSGKTNEICQGSDEAGNDSTNNIPRSMSGRPLPQAPSTGGEYATLGERESAENPRLNYNTESKPTTNDSTPAYASLEDSGQTGIYQPLGNRRQDDVEGDYQGLSGVQDKKGFACIPESGYPRETPNNPMSNDNGYSYARNDDIRSLAKVSPSLSPGNSDSADYITVLDEAEPKEEKAGPYYAKLEGSNLDNNKD